MTSLSSTIKYLAERGITAKERLPGRLQCYVAEDDVIDLDSTEDGYRLRHWMYVPGPGPDDFSVMFASLDEALLALWYYLLGTPTLMGGWAVPFHRQPGWTLSRVAFVTTVAPRLNELQFERIAEQRQQEVYGEYRESGSQPNSGTNSRYAKAMRSQFIRCAPADGGPHVLMLRRDLEEAYIVRTGIETTVTKQEGASITSAPE